MKLFIVISILCLIAQAWCYNVLMFCIYVCVDMRWFGKAVPLIAMGKKTVKQPCHVSTLHPLLTQMFQMTVFRNLKHIFKCLCVMIESSPHFYFFLEVLQACGIFSVTSSPFCP